MNVIQTIINVFRVSELRGKILFTLAMLAVYRIGFWIPVPGVNQQVLSEFFERSAQDGNAAGRLASYVSIFSGGALGQSTIFGLGVMPFSQWLGRMLMYPDQLPAGLMAALIGVS